MESSGSSSYHFLHKTVQEFLAALYESSLPPGERDRFIRSSFGEGSMKMVTQFMAGILSNYKRIWMESILALQKKGRKSLLESCHWLFEAHDPGLVQKCMGDREWEWALGNTTLDPFDCYVLGYCIANSRQPWDVLLRGCSITGECLKMLTVVEKGRAFDYIRNIEFSYNYDLGDQRGIFLGEL